VAVPFSLKTAAMMQFPMNGLSPIEPREVLENIG